MDIPTASETLLKIKNTQPTFNSDELRIMKQAVEYIVQDQKDQYSPEWTVKMIRHMESLGYSFISYVKEDSGGVVLYTMYIRHNRS